MRKSIYIIKENSSDFLVRFYNLEIFFVVFKSGIHPQGKPSPSARPSLPLVAMDCGFLPQIL